MIFNNVLIDFDTNLTIDFEIDYERFLRIDTFIDESVGAGSGGGASVCRRYRKVTGTYSDGEIKQGWRPKVEQAIKSSGIDVKLSNFHLPFLTYNEFLNHLINQEFKKRRAAHLNSLIQTVKGSAHEEFDGTGISLMVLSKLNQLVTNPTPVPYVLDYYQEMYTREDVENIFNALKTSRFNGELYALPQEIMQNGILPDGRPKSYYTIGRDSKILDSHSFFGTCLIVLNKQLLDTYHGCLRKVIAAVR